MTFPEKFPRPLLDILMTVHDALQKERTTAALILLYAAIDGMSHLAEMDTKKGHGATFKSWVRKWMVEGSSLPVNEVDLWSARCGILHQQISESDQTSAGHAREIFYSSGGASPEVLEGAIEQFWVRDAVALPIEDLISIFADGMTKCISEIEKDPKWLESYSSKIVKMLRTYYPDSPKPTSP